MQGQLVDAGRRTPRQVGMLPSQRKFDAFVDPGLSTPLANEAGTTVPKFLHHIHLIARVHKIQVYQGIQVGTLGVSCCWSVTVWTATL